MTMERFNPHVKITRLGADTSRKYGITSCLRKGQVVYTMGSSELHSWEKARIKEEPESFQEDRPPTYQLEIINDNGMGPGKKPRERCVTARFIACYEAPTHRIAIKSRVIACKGKQDEYHLGLISKLPSPLTNHRYLVIFDDDSAHYCYQTEIRLVCWTSKNPFDVIYSLHKKSIVGFFERPIEKSLLRVMRKGDVVQYLHYDEVVQATVLKLDLDVAELDIETESGHIIKSVHRSNRCLLKVQPVVHVNTHNRSLLRSRGFGTAITHSIVNSPTKVKRILIERENHDTAGSSIEDEMVIISSDEENDILIEPKRQKIAGHQDNEDQLKQMTNKVICLPRPAVDLSNKENQHAVVVAKRRIKRSLNLPCPHGFPPLLTPLLYNFTRNELDKKIKYHAPCGKTLNSPREVLNYINASQNCLTIDQFCFDIEVNINRRHLSNETLKLSIEDFSRGKENIKISCVNQFDNTEPQRIDYVTKIVRKLDPPISLQSSGFLSGCDCVDDCMDSDNCSCHQLTVYYEKKNNESTSGLGYQYRRLYSRVDNGIYECNKMCKCSAKCLNRVVQHPISTPLEIFMTEKKGWGVRSLRDIPRGTFVCTYTGELLTEEEAEKLGKTYGDRYLAELDHIEVAERMKEGYESEAYDSLDEEKDNPKDLDFFVGKSAPKSLNENWEGRLRKRKQQKSYRDAYESEVHVFNNTRLLFGPKESPLIVNAANIGNVGRFFNHSCSPNVFIQNVFYENHDLRVPTLAFFTSMHVPAGTEICFDYGYDIGKTDKKIQCFCESKNCKGRLL